MSITLLNTSETYSALQPFQSIEELNANTSEIRTQFADQLTPSTYAVLDVLHRYASKYYGVSYRSKSKIALELGISRRTVVRACNTLESLGVIEQHALKRHNGDKRQSSNAIVFVDAVTPECHTVDAPNNAPKDLSTTYVTDAPADKNDNSAVKEIEKKDDRELLKDSLPSGWYEEAVAYTTDYTDLYRITGELFKAKVNTSIRVETYVAEFGDVLQGAWAKLKNGRINPSKWYAYLFTAFRRKAHAIERAETVNPILGDIAAMMGV